MRLIIIDELVLAPPFVEKAAEMLVEIKAQETVIKPEPVEHTKRSKGDKKRAKREGSRWS